MRAESPWISTWQAEGSAESFVNHLQPFAHPCGVQALGFLYAGCSEVTIIPRLNLILLMGVPNFDAKSQGPQLSLRNQFHFNSRFQISFLPETIDYFPSGLLENPIKASLLRSNIPAIMAREKGAVSQPKSDNKAILFMLLKALTTWIPFASRSSAIPIALREAKQAFLI